MAIDQAQYTYRMFNQSYLALDAIVTSQQYATERFCVNLLNWISQALHSDVILLSWSDTESVLHVRESVIVNTPALEEQDSVARFGRLDEWLRGEEDTWERDNTSNISELKEAHIRSLMLAKVFTSESDDFQGRALLMACNKTPPVAEGRVYLSYDRLFLRVAKWMLLLYISDLYNLANKRYQDAKARYSSSQTASSLALVEETASSLLSLYSKYCAIPSWQLLYDYLDARIALFNTKEISEDGLRSVLDSCRKGWLIEFQVSQSEKDITPIRCALARGYFTLGIEQDDDWVRGKKLLGEHRELQREND